MGLNRRLPQDDDARAEYRDSRRKSKSEDSKGLWDVSAKLLADYLKKNEREWLIDYIFYFLITDIVYNEDKTMGVAIGGKAKPINSRFTSDSWAVVDLGLLIFFFDTDGKLIDFTFIPFSDLEDGLGGVWDDVRELLEKYGISEREFHDVLDELMDMLDDMIDDITDMVTGMSVLSGASIFIPIIGAPVGACLATGAIVLSIEAKRYDKWRDILEAFQDLVAREI